MRKEIIINEDLKLIPTELSNSYRKKRNVNPSLDDFFHLEKNGQIINNKTIYRIGGLGLQKDDNYFMLLKQVEDKYPTSITKIKSKRNHLSDKQTILDKYGNELYVHVGFGYVYLHGGVIYSIDGILHNILNGKPYTKYKVDYINSKTHIAYTESYLGDIQLIDKKTGLLEILN